MKPEELRIGNLVESSTGNNIVLLIDRHFVELGYFTDSVGFVRKYEEIKPIPLTKEWFIKMGGVKEPYEDDPDDYYLVIRHEDFDFIYENDTIIYCDISGVEIPLNYVHTAQNLWYALTGEGLKIQQ